MQWASDPRASPHLANYAINAASRSAPPAISNAVACWRVLQHPVNTKEQPETTGEARTERSSLPGVQGTDSDSPRQLSFDASRAMRRRCSASASARLMSVQSTVTSRKPTLPAASGSVGSTAVHGTAQSGPRTGSWKVASMTCPQRDGSSHSASSRAHWSSRRSCCRCSRGGGGGSAGPCGAAGRGKVAGMGALYVIGHQCRRTHADNPSGIDITIN